MSVERLISQVPGAVLEHQNNYCGILGQTAFFNLGFAGKTLGGAPGKEKKPPGDCVGIHSCGSLELFVSVKRWSRGCLHHTARSSDLEEFSPGKKQKEGRRKETVKTRHWIVAQLVK